MPLRNSYGFSDSEIIHGDGLQSESRIAKLYRRLLAVYKLVHIVYWLVVGVFLMLLPWQQFWDNNVLLYRIPSLRPIVVSPFLKGAILGLGIINLLIGLHELLNFGDTSRNQSRNTF